MIIEHDIEPEPSTGKLLIQFLGSLVLFVSGILLILWAVTDAFSPGNGFLGIR